MVVWSAFATCAAGAVSRASRWLVSAPLASPAADEAAKRSHPPTTAPTRHSCSDYSHPPQPRRAPQTTHLGVGGCLARTGLTRSPSIPPEWRRRGGRVLIYAVGVTQGKQRSHRIIVQTSCVVRQWRRTHATRWGAVRGVTAAAALRGTPQPTPGVTTVSCPNTTQPKRHAVVTPQESVGAGSTVGGVRQALGPIAAQEQRSTVQRNAGVSATPVRVTTPAHRAWTGNVMTAAKAPLSENVNLALTAPTAARVTALGHPRRARRQAVLVTRCEQTSAQTGLEPVQLWWCRTKAAPSGDIAIHLSGVGYVTGGWETS
eukprot:Hpha_TRINITY_DN16682_c0_g1::TRINITY_DN16682_c0_g1_i10::g.183838::m.183838